MIVAPFLMSARLALRAAGFIATSTSGESPGVRMSWSAKCTWNDDTPGQRALRCPDLGREVRQRRQVVAERRGLLGEAVAGELHAVAGVAGEADDHAVELLDLLDLLGHAVSPSFLREHACAPLYSQGALTWWPCYDRACAEGASRRTVDPGSRGFGCSGSCSSPGSPPWACSMSGSTRGPTRAGGGPVTAPTRPCFVSTSVRALDSGTRAGSRPSTRLERPPETASPASASWG